MGGVRGGRRAQAPCVESACQQTMRGERECASQAAVVAPQSNRAARAKQRKRDREEEADDETAELSRTARQTQVATNDAVYGRKRKVEENTKRKRT